MVHVYMEKQIECSIIIQVFICVGWKMSEAIEIKLRRLSKRIVLQSLGILCIYGYFGWNLSMPGNYTSLSKTRIYHKI
jgi:hypothetical protein